MSWADLREIRRAGLKPSLPVVVTVDGKRPAHLLRDEGCLVIRHEPKTPFPAELLDGLRVWLFVGCDRAQSVVRAMNAKDVHPVELKAWCVCAGMFDPLPVGCEDAIWH